MGDPYTSKFTTLTRQLSQWLKKWQILEQKLSCPKPLVMKLKRKKRKVKLPSTLKKMLKLLSMPLKMPRRNLSTMKRNLIKKIRLTKLKMIKMINLRKSQRKKPVKN